MALDSHKCRKKCSKKLSLAWKNIYLMEMVFFLNGRGYKKEVWNSLFILSILHKNQLIFLQMKTEAHFFIGEFWMLLF